MLFSDPADAYKAAAAGLASIFTPRRNPRDEPRIRAIREGADSTPQGAQGRGSR